jgi:hypothetical protein
MDNIIQFPVKNSTKGFPNNLEQSYEHIEEVRRDYCDEISADIMEAVLGVLASYNISVLPDESVVKNVVFLEETVKALVYSTKKLEHPFQDIAQQAITLTDEARDELKEIIDRKTVDHLNE